MTLAFFLCGSTTRVRFEIFSLFFFNFLEHSSDERGTIRMIHASMAVTRWAPLSASLASGGKREVKRALARKRDKRWCATCPCEIVAPHIIKSCSLIGCTWQRKYLRDIRPCGRIHHEIFMRCPPRLPVDLCHSIVHVAHRWCTDASLGPQIAAPTPLGTPKSQRQKFIKKS